jgi:hypothetical protein
MKLLKHKITGRHNSSINGEFLLRRNRRGPATHQSDDIARLSRSKVSEK